MTESMRRPSTLINVSDHYHRGSLDLTGIVGNKVCDPVIPDILHSGRLGVEVRQRNNSIPFPAFFHHSQIAVVGDLAVRVEIIFGIEWIEDTVVYCISSSSIALFQSKISKSFLGYNQEN